MSETEPLEREKQINELVREALLGNTSQIYELWKLVEKLCAWYCRKVYNQMPRSFLLEYDDLYNCGFIALRDALEHYCPDKGGKFSAFYLFYLTSAIYRENGLDTGGHDKGGHRRFDPGISGETLHLDAETDEQGEKAGTLLDVLSDEANGPSIIASVEERIFYQQLHDALEALIAELPTEEQILVRQKYFGQIDRLSIAEQLCISKDEAISLEDRALINLRRRGEDTGLEQFLSSRINYHAGTGLKRFKETDLSSTERLAMKRIDLEAKYRKLSRK